MPIDLELLGVDTLVLDLGGVLLELDELLPWEQFRSIGADIDTPEIQEKLFELCNLFEVGGKEPMEWAKEMAEIMGIDCSFAEVFEIWNSMLLDIPDERIDVIRELSKRYRLILLSNTNEIHLRTLYSREHLNYEEDKLLGDHFDQEYFSNKLGLRKPDREIFEVVLEHNDLEPSQCLFIDDKVYNLQGAVEVGMNVYHLDLTKEDFSELF